MAQKPFILNRERFDALCRVHNLSSPTAFCDKTGMPRRTFYDVLDGRTDIKGATIAYFLDAFPMASFEDLFTRTTEQATVRTIVRSVA